MMRNTKWLFNSPYFSVGGFGVSVDMKVMGYIYYLFPFLCAKIKGSSIRNTGTNKIIRLLVLKGSYKGLENIYKCF